MLKFSRRSDDDRFTSFSAMPIAMSSVLITAGAILSASPSFAQTFTSQTVLATASIYTPGYDSAPGGSTSASSFALSAGSNRILTFTSVTGLTDTGGPTPIFGPDGGAYGYTTDISAYGGISGVTDSDDLQGYLVGLFVNGTIPNGQAAPATLDFTGAFKNQASYSPLLNQVFFIGDGLTGTGTGAAQQFFVPTGATTLYLGLVDGFSFTGNPDAYGDNSGSYSASFSVASGSTTSPEPGALFLFVVGAATARGGRIARRRRRS